MLSPKLKWKTYRFARLSTCLCSLRGYRPRLTGGYVAPPSATPKFTPLSLCKLHISPER